MTFITDFDIKQLRSVKYVNNGTVFLLTVPCNRRMSQLSIVLQSMMTNILMLLLSLRRMLRSLKQFFLYERM